MKKRSSFPPRLPPRDAEVNERKKIHRKVWVNPQSMMKAFSKDAWNPGPCTSSGFRKLIDLRARSHELPHRSICAQ